MKFAVIESMSKIEWGDFTVRVWRNEVEVYGHYPNELMKAAIIELIKQHKDDLHKIAECACEDFPDINAIEVLKFGEGIVCYPNWP